MHTPPHLFTLGALPSVALASDFADATEGSDFPVLSSWLHFSGGLYGFVCEQACDRPRCMVESMAAIDERLGRAAWRR